MAAEQARGLLVRSSRRQDVDGQNHGPLRRPPVSYPFGEVDTLVPANAGTIHSAQVSEEPAVIIPVLTEHCTMLQRNLPSTGVTRARRLVVLVGQQKAVAIAVRKVSGRRRWSQLHEWLGATVVPGSAFDAERPAAWERGATATFAADGRVRPSFESHTLAAPSRRRLSRG